MIGMFLLKHAYALFDEQASERCLHEPYFQYFTGDEFIQQPLVRERSGLIPGIIPVITLAFLSPLGA